MSPGMAPPHAIERAIRLGPAVEVALGIADDGRLAGRSRRRMDPDDLVARHRKHAERIIISQVRLERERKPREVGE